MKTPPGFFSREELLLPPNLVSALRFPLALVFPLAARMKGGALTVLALAALTDMLDGWLARESSQVTATGAVLDPLADKAFALSVVATLLAQGKIPTWGIPALLAREILEAPLIVWILIEGRRGNAPTPEVHANVPGKLATTAQFAAVMAALELPAALQAALLLSGVSGAVAGVAYWRREVGRRTGRRT